MKLSRRKKHLRNKAVEKARKVLDNQMPKNTNFTSDSARQRIAELITDMMFSEFIVESRSSRSLLDKFLKRL
jgi:hypothetical protein